MLFEKYIKKMLEAMSTQNQLQMGYFQKQLDKIKLKLTPEERKVAMAYCNELGKQLHKEG